MHKAFKEYTPNLLKPVWNEEKQTLIIEVSYPDVVQFRMQIWNKICLVCIFFQSDPVPTKYYSLFTKGITQKYPNP